MDSECVFLQEKYGGVSKFELDEKWLKYGTIHTPYDVSSHPVAELGEEPEDRGFSYSNRDGIKFAVDKDGEVWSDDLKTHLGKFSDMDETPDEEEMRAGIAWLANRLKREFGNGKEREREEMGQDEPEEI